MRKFLLMLLAICITTFSCQARTSELVGKGAGYGPYNGWVVAESKPFDKTGEFIRYTDMRSNQDLYRKIIDVAKTKFSKYQQMTK